MQGKELSNQEARVECSVGIDVSKSWLDVCVLPRGETLRLGNTLQGLRQLKRWLRGRRVALIALEATGKWHRAAHRSLYASGLPVTVVDPFRVRMFAKAAGILAKTDRLDAQVLASFAATMDPRIRPPAPEALDALQELVRARHSATTQNTSLRNQLASAQTAFVRRHLKGRITRLKSDIAKLQTEIERRIADDPRLAQRYRILNSIPGVGPIVAATLLASLPELGDASRRQIAMLAGLAPLPDDSGQRQGIRRIKGGRPLVRSMLYLAALSAKRGKNDLGTFYNHLTNIGKKAKVAIIAVARKLVVLANTLIAESRTWTPNPPITT